MDSERPLHIAMLCGSLPPDPCGVGDFTAGLIEQLRAQGHRVSVCYGKRWQGASWGRWQRLLAQLDCDCIHLQYPSYGFGLGPRSSLVPHLLALRFPMLVTLHEVSQIHPIRRWSETAFALRAPALITTNRIEAAAAAGCWPWMRGRIAVIPLGSPVPFRQRPWSERSDDIVTFGLLRPEKGLEEVLALGRLLAERGARRRIRIIGKSLPDDGGYADALRRQAAGLPIDFLGGRDPAGVAAIFSACRYGYFPFPDGASERRSSLIAAMGNGLCVISSEGAQTTPVLREGLALAADAGAALDLLERADADPGWARERAAAAARSMRAYTWPAVGAAHEALYRRLIGGRGPVASAARGASMGAA